MQALKGQVAIVTGAGHAKGIGRAIALKLAKQGAKIALVDLFSGDDLEAAAANIREAGVDAIGVHCDITQRKEIDAAVAQIIRHFACVDILVNNAGVGLGSADFLELTDRDWDISYAVNLKGMANFCQALLPTMIAREGGNIINIASLAGLGAIEGIPVCYTASKFAVVGLTKQLAINYAKYNIRCNAVCPGSIVTQMHEQTLKLIAEEHQIDLQEAQDRESANIPLGYSAQPDQIGEAVVYLASPAASYVTGITLPVAGGMTPGL